MKNIKILFSKNKKSLALIVSMIILGTFAAGSTIAWLKTETDTVTNTFEKAYVDCEVKEDWTPGEKKQDVKIKNTSNIDAYIRVAVIPEFEDDEGNVVAQSCELSDLNIIFNGIGTKWIEKDGYYYYKEKVSSGSNTDILIKKATLKTKNNCNLNLHIMAEAIQAQPKDVVESAWGVTVDKDGKLS